MMFNCIRIAVNIYFVDIIRGYISIFGIKKPECQCVMWSHETEDLVQYYELCIDYIELNRFENTDFAIDRTNGRKLLKRANRVI